MPSFHCVLKLILKGTCAYRFRAVPGQFAQTKVPDVKFHAKGFNEGTDDSPPNSNQVTRIVPGLPEGFGFRKCFLERCNYIDYMLLVVGDATKIPDRTDGVENGPDKPCNS